MVKVNTDANMQSHGKWGLGIIIRDKAKLVMAASTWETDGIDNVLEVEAHALLTGMRFAKDSGFRTVVFEGDNEKLMRLVREDYVHNRSYLGLMLQEIHRAKSSFDTYQFLFTLRSGNKVANRLAQLAHFEPNKVWMEEVPLEISSLYFQDNLN